MLILIIFILIYLEEVDMQSALSIDQNNLK